jgi:hypothetical protein
LSFRTNFYRNSLVISKKLDADGQGMSIAVFEHFYGINGLFYQER